MGRKIWGGQSIREFARARLRASELTPGQITDQTNVGTNVGTGLHNPPFSMLEGPLDPNDADFASPPDGHKFQWGNFQESIGNRVYVVVPAEEDNGDHEIEKLCSTLGLQTAFVQTLSSHRKTDPATFLGRGTVEDIKESMQRLGCTALVVDAPLRPGQVRSIEQILEAPVVDREGIILEIFSHHAKTRLAKMQVELAQLKYLQPRLAGLWMGLSRQRGGRGGLGGRGLGETRLELDRRVVKDRISALSRKLKDAERTLDVQSKRRAHFPRVALVGYTNAGKSTLMRRLTGTSVEARDSLFSTLDTTIRMLTPPTQPQVLVSDTVGFVRHLPHDLVASFKSTLREALESQLILHVLDASHEHWESQFETTESALTDLGCDSATVAIPKILVLNKTDSLRSKSRGRMAEFKLARIERETLQVPNYVACVSISALTGAGLDELRQKILEVLGVELRVWTEA